MKRYTATVVFDIEIELDESKFDEAFLGEFRESFYNFQDIEDHVMHIAQLEARGLLQDFTEGYGPIADMGINARTIGWNVDEIAEA